mgnify:FL=1|jgi:hypothetical protein|tara:strand:- start:1031 stop:1480 length:450 start_codon:yes stop_codon:yes gene_type:complete
MSMCKICHKDSKKHSEKLWRLHQMQKKCAFCGKSSKKHSVKLWEIHEKAIPKGKKLVVIQAGFGPKTRAMINEWNTVNGSPYHIERIPLSLHCSHCNASMSDKESDLADVLDSLCLECFCEQTDQEYTWHSKPWWAVNGGKYSGGPLVH